MTGFIRGFFGRKEKKEDVTPPPAPRVVRERQSNAIFLDADDAKSFGNIEYMRSIKSVRRTFPKTVNNEEMELIQKVSALEKAKAVGDQAAVSALASEIQQSADSNGVRPEVRQAAIAEVASTNGKVDRSSADSSLDMFRKMARDIKKR